MVRVVHFSDWHGQRMALPVADVYVCTGDMLPNFPTLLVEVDVPYGSGERYVDWKVNRELVGLEQSPVPQPYVQVVGRRFRLQDELDCQNLWMSKVPSLRECFGNPDAPVVCVRGNHDFVDIAPLFGGDTFEIVEPGDCTTVVGLRFGGMRGINAIVGDWSDEYEDHEFDDKARKLPVDLDVLVTHSPPHGKLDQYPPGRCLGARALTQHLMRCEYVGKVPLLHTFGHIHECQSLETGSIHYSNAATRFNVIDL